MRPNLRHFTADSAPLVDSGANNQTLAAQVSDIAQRISRLHRIVGTEGSDSAGMVDADTLRLIIQARRTRVKFFSPGLFADPAWDILLDLLLSKLTDHRVTVSNVCVASAVPATTALRWIKAMESEGLVFRRADPLDGRRFFIALTAEAENSLRRYFAEIDFKLVI